MHPTTLSLYTRMKREDPKGPIPNLIERARHVHVPLSMFQSCWEIAHGAVEAQCNANGSWGAMPSMAVPFADLIALTVGDSGQVHFISRLAGDSSICWVSGYARSGPIRAIAHWHPQQLPFLDSNGLAGSDEEKHSSVFVFGILLSLLNEPRRVVQRAAEGPEWTRPHRREVERVTGRAALAYTVVSWEVGSGVRALGSTAEADQAFKMPLHWCRAHWRESNSTCPSAQWVTPMFRRPGWYVWVRDCWKGHPDHGIKVQRHEPRMPGESPVRVKQDPVPSAAKLDALAAQQRAMLVQSGHAPSASLH